MTEGSSVLYLTLEKVFYTRFDVGLTLTGVLYTCEFVARRDEDIAELEAEVGVGSLPAEFPHQILMRDIAILS